MSDGERVETGDQQGSQLLGPRLVVVGGFLGAGKTTLLLAAARELARRGLRSAIVLNDQSEGLVDTAYAELHGVLSGEVAGGCFCCRFSDLLHALNQMRAHGPDVIFAEPVGSCTDISATILHPLQELGAGYRLAPYTVLVDPERARMLLREDANEHMAFLFRKQIAEADLVCFTKADVSSEVPFVYAPNVRQLSAQSGRGVSAWLDEVLASDAICGGEILDLDYAQYARAEAALAWLNLRVTLRPVVPASPAAVLGPLVDAIDSTLTEAGVAIVHLKAVMRTESGFINVAVCDNRAEPRVEGTLDASPATRHDLLLNLRCVGDAETVKGHVERCLCALDADMSDLHLRAFHPTAPCPERRVVRKDVEERALSRSERNDAHARI